jgi:hypothetical protein
MRQHSERSKRHKWSLKVRLGEVQLRLWRGDETQHANQSEKVTALEAKTPLAAAISASLVVHDGYAQESIELLLSLSRTQTTKPSILKKGAQHKALWQ